MFGSFLPSLWSSSNQSVLRSREPTLLCNQVPERCLIGFLMAKFRFEWFLFDYKKGYPDRISKPFKTKAAAEKAREKHPAKVWGGIGVGMSQIPITTPK